MASTLRTIHKKAVFEYPTAERVDWVKDNVGMVVNTGAQIWWTFETIDVFRRVREGDKTGMKRFANKNHKVLNDLIVAVRTPGTKQQTKRINTLIIIDVHARDIIDTFVRDSVLDEREFAVVAAALLLGPREGRRADPATGPVRLRPRVPGPRRPLVITPLTDRCYMTCTQSLHYRRLRARRPRAPARPRRSRL